MDRFETLMSGKNESNRSPNTRVILLLDLDCFYAQCEIIRLGLDQQVPLALLQWDSALAVNYPARKYGIKRGDSFDIIKEKSKGECISIHLPLLSINTPEKLMERESATYSGIQTDESALSSVDEAYAKEFELSEKERKACFEKERNKMRHSHEGKASLERYRIASAKIFSTMMQALCEGVGRGNFVLERASIDEIFLDVTRHCHDFSKDAWVQPESVKSLDANDEINDFYARKITITCYEDKLLRGGGDDATTQALWRGCQVALGLRQAVLKRLGFTLSAGISINKSIAKLGAGFGKPNGQAVVLPSAIPALLDETPIRKVRNLGGKVGKKVLAILPEGRDTLGSIANYLSLQELTNVLDSKMASLVYDLSHGVDNEEVKETVGALTKSITAFKSFQKTDANGIQKWIDLLASDIITRVELDSARNRRTPKLCVVQYTGPAEEWGKTRSLSLPFPKGSDQTTRLKKLIEAVRQNLITKGSFPIRRLGLSATDFEVQVTKGIDSYFGKAPDTHGTDPKRRGVEGGGVEHVPSAIDDGGVECSYNPKDLLNESTTRRLTFEEKTCCQTNSAPRDHVKSDPNKQNDELKRYPRDDDMEYARLLQASYDREHEVLSTIEAKHSSSLRGKGARKKRDASIENFFSKKKR